MHRITNKSQLEVAYVLLRYYAEKTDQLKLSDHDKALLDENIKEVKQEIRRYNNQPVNETRVIKDYGIDGYVLLEPLPERITLPDAAEEYFMDVHYIPEPRSMYDCTGKPFTVWHRIIHRHGRYWAYHSIAFDV